MGSPRRTKVWTPERLRKRRTALGYTQQDVADECGVTQASVHYWEQGTTLVPRKRWGALNEMLCVGGRSR